MKRPRSELQRRLSEQASRNVRLAMRLNARHLAPKTEIDLASTIEEVRGIDPARLVRDPDARRFHFRTRDVGKVRLAVANHLYARYPVARHLEAIWHYAETPYERRPPSLRPGEMPDKLTCADVARRRDWYIVAASGGSLYKERTRPFFSKRETHVFLTVPFALSFDEAVIFALARSHTDDLALCRRLAKTKLNRKEFIVDARTSPSREREAAFWKEAVRFFSLHTASSGEIDDLIDYLGQVRRRNRSFSLKGRTIGSLTAAMHDWHRDLARVRRLGDYRWAGLGVPDSDYMKLKLADRVVDWRFAQVKCSKDLAEEGNEMRHCVYTYQGRCRSGAGSIWSMRVRNSGSGADFVRKITFEVDHPTRKIVQVRGYANRRATGDERAILRRWAADNGVIYEASTW